jgi:two-component system, OmpR family, sensor kinase
MNPYGDLRRLRLRLTLLYTTALAVGLIALAVITITVDGRLRDARSQASLIGLASRATTLVDDSVSPPDVNGISQDIISQRTTWQVYSLEANKALKPIRRGISLDGSEVLARRALRDDLEKGTTGSVRINGKATPAAAMPFYRGDVVGGAVVLAAPYERDPDHQRLVLLLLGATLLLTAIGAGAGWLLAGRSIRPAVLSLERQEQFLTAAAHEIRTPISRVRAVADVARLLSTDIVSVEGESAAALTDLRSELDRLCLLSEETGVVIEDLLTVARVDGGRLVLAHERVDVSTIFYGLQRGHSTLRVETQGSLMLMGDRPLLTRVFANLVTNSERHGSTGTTRPTIVATLIETEHGILVEVRDDGRGIPERLLPEVFDRFRSGHPGGSGIGLWLARWIVEAHGGVITARNDNGAVFSISLPHR